jgi:hypothetical protein
MDEVMAINEVLNLDKNSKQDSLIFKVYFEKSYDLVSCSFLEYML